MDDNQRAPRLGSATRGGLITTRPSALIVSLALIVLVLSPIAENFKDSPEDGFPLSYYPMFATKREDDLAVTHIVGIAADGSRRVIPYYYAAPGGFNSARKRINRIRRDGASDLLCEHVARTLAEEPHDLTEVRKVLIVTGTNENERFFQGAATPSHEKVHAACPVSR